MIRTCLLLLVSLAVVPTLVACQGVGGAASDPTPAVAPPFPSSAEASAADPKASVKTTRDAVAQPANVASQNTPAAARVSYEGTAHNAKLGAVLVDADGVRHWVELDSWPDNVLGKKVVLEATPVVRYDLPVVAAAGAEVSAGVPIESGQTADEAARREVLTALIWKLAE
jgi:hypothetical protein